MTDAKLDKKTKKRILGFQKDEISEHHIYKKLAKRTKDTKNKEILKKISNEELEHYNTWKTYTNKEVKPSKLKIWKYYLISIIFGITFGIKLMEGGEEGAQKSYGEILKLMPIPEIERIIKEEQEHESQLIKLIDEERLKYVSSMVLGLNDALVELTGALAGFTLTFQNTLVIAVAGLVTGIAAALSMAASEYLSTKSEEQGEKSPAKASLYTGFAYILVVFLLILPYFIITDIYICLGLTICSAILVILLFTYYISVAKDLNFKRRFLEMALISLGIAAISYLVGFVLRTFFHIEV